MLGSSLLGLLLIGLPLGIYQYFQHQNSLVEQEITAEILKDEDLRVYNLDVDVNQGNINLSGKLPSEYLKQKLTSLVEENSIDLPINNEVTIVDLPANQGEIEEEINKVLRVFNQIEGINIQTNFNQGILTLTGQALQITDLQNITSSFAKIRGINQVKNEIELKPLQIPTRVYFSGNSVNVSARDIEGKLIPIKEQMKQYPQTKLKIIGYRSSGESANIPLRRAQTVENILEDLGVDRRRVTLEDGINSPPDVTSNQEKWLSQVVVFELNWQRN